jgi:hypothetical protein
MKKILFPAIALFSFIASAQTFVSTSVENKNVILEEYTGISCVYCPDGHKIAQDLHNANPNDVFLINVHTGGYANPQGPDTDFNTSFGSALAGQTGLTGYPSGTVNRHIFSGSTTTAQSRSAWVASSNTIMNVVSPVNVGIQSSIDMATNTMTVDVEVYYTGTQTITSNQLNIAIVQNGILGPQTGGASYNPTAIDPATGLYTHNHMLRHMLTGQWGETISNISQGTLYTNSYTWAIPNQLSGFSLSPVIDATNLAIVAFVSEGNQEILSGTELYPDLIFANAYDANLVASSATDIMCTPTTDLTVDFKNYGNTNLTSVNIEYSINGGTTTIYPWNGNLTPGASETVVISNISVSPNVSNTVDITLASPNGNTDQNLSNNNTQCTFNGMYDAPSGDITIEVTTDNYPSETTWKLKENGNVIASGGPYTTAGSAQTPAIIAAGVTPGSCYIFIMEDSYGDGMLSPGSYKVIDANGSTIVWGGTNSPNGNFTSEESTYFESNSGVTPSWDCDANGNCQDPGNGSGQYTDLSNCLTACNVTSVDNQNLESISIYPNPVKNILNISGTFELVEIYDVFGKLVLTSTKNTINTSDLANGIYVLNINTNNSIITKRITVTK